MIIPIILCPSWSVECPPYNIALIKAVLIKAGYDAKCYDFNVDFYNSVTDENERESWHGMIKGRCWDKKDFVMNIFNKYIDLTNSFIDEIFKLDSKVIGFSLNSQNYIFTLEVIKRIKELKEDKIIILGGPLCFRNDRGIEALIESRADAVCLGEGERSFVNILGIIKERGCLDKCPGIAFKDKAGNIIDGGDESLLEDISALPFADFSDFKFSDYKKKIIPISIGRGCVNRCVFCSESDRFKKYRTRSAINIYDEILYQKEKYQLIEEFFFNDSLVNGDIEVLDELCTLIIKNKLNIRWSGQTSVRNEMSLEFLRKIKKSGCWGLSYGVESGSDKILKLMRKTFNVELANKVIRETNEAGIDEGFNIIVGFPGEDEKEFTKTVDFVRNNLKYVNTVTLNPLYISREMYFDKEKWKISWNDNYEEWYSIDGENNKDKRFERLKILKEMVGNKISMNFDFEVERFLKKGDECFKKNNKNEALQFYLSAREINKDKNFESIIEEKIKNCNMKNIKFSWDIHYKCNFRCPYCWFYKEWANMKKRNVYLSPDEWMTHWKRIYDKYGEVKIEIVGGEPSIYPNFIELVKKLSSIHLVKITTNLSGDVERFVKEISPARVNLDLNYHVFFIDLETVIRKARILNDAGFKSGICFLAYPPQMGHIDKLSKVFKEAGINFALAAFWGEHEGKKYPESYTQEDKEMMRPYLGDVDRLSYHLNAKSPRGKLCNAGYKYASIQGDGNVVRCGPLSDKSLGNIMDEDFKILDSPLPCEADHCPCNEYDNLITC